MEKKTDSFKRKPQSQILQLRITLPEIEPNIWRRIMVPSIFTLEALHSVIQLTMGWQMKHLYDFQIGKSRFAEPDDLDDQPVRGLATSLAAALREETSFIYNYDFGDGWTHQVFVEEVSTAKQGVTYPICIGGENACPPEDCGGPHGYEEFKKAIANSKHPDHLQMLQWVGGHFDPFSFDPNRINRDMLWLIDWRRPPNDQGLYLPFNYEDGERVDGHQLQ